MHNIFIETNADKIFQIFNYTAVLCEAVHCEAAENRARLFRFCPLCCRSLVAQKKNSFRH